MKGFGVFLLVAIALVAGFLAGACVHRGTPANDSWLQKNITYEVVSSTEVGVGNAKSYLLVLRTLDGETLFCRLKENPPKRFYIERRGSVVFYFPHETNSPNPTPH